MSSEPADVTAPQAAPSRWREFLAVLVLVVLCDLTIYRGEGFAGYALLFVLAPALLAAGSVRPRSSWGLWIVSIMLAVLAARLLWCGSILLVGAGFALLVAFAMALSGLRPYVLEVAVFASQTILAGYQGLVHHWRSVSGISPTVRRGVWLSVALPVVAFLAFGTIFILANPNLVAFFGETVQQLFETVRDWIINYAPGPMEIIFWIAVVWIAVGLLRPAINRALFEEAAHAVVVPSGEEAPAQTTLYPAFRNTLITVIILFAVYLGFEFKTLWFRVFPEKFHYSGYAHEGAAWLTLALALATVVLSLVFSGRMLQDPRLSRLRKLAWIWSLENMLLAVAVYNRLYIYIGFNGMTRMRIVGIFGMSAVVVGFILVVWKITRSRDFVWLMRRHLWTLAVTIYLFAITPVDALWVSYNVQRILEGAPAPSVQISAHPINSEGVLLLHPLLECDDEIIREGVRALLAEQHHQAEELAAERGKQGWTTHQIADGIALEGLRAASDDWAQYADPDRRAEVRKRFDDYAYQWW